MRSAIRGDFERLAERRGGQELMRQPEPEPEPEPASEPETASELEPVPEPEPARDPEPDVGVEPGLIRTWPGDGFDPGPGEPSRVVEDEPAAEVPGPRKTFLDRLLGR
jgi:hypothetical protein